jgi:hypothetical protein
MAYVRKCPWCGGKKGFQVAIALQGYQYESYTFGGKPIDTEREPVDTIEKYATCLDCGKTIPIEEVKFNH